ncbi:MAG: bifunctional (p)ppGpp synthetase/guanosine-3',5'-bis(diphosphate) 3'-pyrophosphohydrolase [Clostridiales bacterium]|nr:bifunctional (p)ppGpp synthetase/guanosine-3',5'-bis(diphosphate) 3'-pyrophosphohydrolase [Clostridiales bacterium]
MLEELRVKVIKAFGEDQAARVRSAYEFAEKAHSGQKRSSGEPYSIHPLAVANILTDLGMDADTIISGLLHDTIEDTGVTKEALDEKFGTEVAMMVDGVTKLSRLSYKTKEEHQVENLRKMFLAMAKDIRVIIIKLADRLHNLRTLEYVDEESQRAKAYETLEIYAPLAHRLGIFKVKWELEDISLRYIDSKGYYDLVEKVSLKRREREAYIQQVIVTLKEKLNEIPIEYEIEGRPKNFYSIYKKMYMQHKNFEQIYDLLAIRVLVNTVKDCYGVLGVAHTLWKPIPGRFKDYIAVPKPNMYQSLHTTVIGPEGDPFEIQIRTWEMHRTAEYGIAAHWKYKEGSRTSYDMDKKLSWLRQLLEWQNESRDARDFMETLKIDLFTDEVFVFTPKGDVINLPKGATPLDFAYAIHSAIGNRCIGAKVSGKIVTLDYELETGDIVEILTTQSTSHGPSRDWLKIVKTNQARNKIKQWFKKERREENIEKGKEMLEREAKRQGYPLSQLLKNEWIDGIFKKYGFTSMDDLYSALGYGGISTGPIMTRLLEEYRKANTQETPESIIKESRAEKEKEIPGNGIQVKGVDNIMIRFAKCCNPVPGDPIIGYITKGRGVSVHRGDCVNLADEFVETNRLIEVSWIGEHKAAYNAEIQIVAQDRQALLADLTNAIADIKINVTAINARTAKNKMVVVNMNMEIHDTKQLEKVMKFLGRLPDVMDVYRVNA